MHPAHKTQYNAIDSTALLIGATTGMPSACARTRRAHAKMYYLFCIGCGVYPVVLSDSYEAVHEVTPGG